MNLSLNSTFDLASPFLRCSYFLGHDVAAIINKVFVWLIVKADSDSGSSPPVREPLIIVLLKNCTEMI